MTTVKGLDVAAQVVAGMLLCVTAALAVASFRGPRGVNKSERGSFVLLLLVVCLMRGVALLLMSSSQSLDVTAPAVVVCSALSNLVFSFAGLMSSLFWLRVRAVLTRKRRASSHIQFTTSRGAYAFLFAVLVVFESIFALITTRWGLPFWVGLEMVAGIVYACAALAVAISGWLLVQTLGGVAGLQVPAAKALYFRLRAFCIGASLLFGLRGAYMLVISSQVLGNNVPAPVQWATNPAVADMYYVIESTVCDLCPIAMLLVLLRLPCSHQIIDVGPADTNEAPLSSPTQASYGSLR